MEHSAKFEFWRNRYNNGWCTKAQLKRCVRLGVITEEEYKEITGEDYE